MNTQTLQAADAVFAYVAANSTEGVSLDLDTPAIQARAAVRAVLASYGARVVAGLHPENLAAFTEEIKRLPVQPRLACCPTCKRPLP